MVFNVELNRKIIPQLILNVFFVCISYCKGMVCKGPIKYVRLTAQQLRLVGMSLV